MSKSRGIAKSFILMPRHEAASVTSAAVAGCLLFPLVSKAAKASRAVREMPGNTSKQSVKEEEERRLRNTGEKRRSRSLFKVTKVPSFVCT